MTRCARLSVMTCPWAEPQPANLSETFSLSVSTSGGVSPCGAPRPREFTKPQSLLHLPATGLRYDVEHFSMRTGSQHYPVSMVTTPCRFGGSRWWWVCPATGRRVGKLYLPNGGARVLSRGLGAYQLAYWLSCARAAGTRAGKTGMRGLSARRHLQADREADIVKVQEWLGHANNSTISIPRSARPAYMIKQ